MASRHFALPLAIVTLLSAVLVRGSGGGDDSSASSSRKAKPGSGAKAASVASNAGDDEDATDVLDVLAQSYGVDLAPHRLMQMAARAMAQLKDRSTAPEDFRRSLLFINDLVALDLRESTAGSRQAARESATRLTNRTLSLGHEAIPEDAAGDVGRIAAFVDPYVAREHVSSNQLEDDADSDFAAVDKTALKRGVLARAIDRHDSSVRYLIASLPDPVDSYTGWQFDPMLDGIVQAISASDYILDRFYLPGSQPGASEDQEALRRQLHDAQPGLVVFKRQVGESTRPDDAPAACLPNRNRPGGMVTGTGSAQVPVWQDRLVLMIVHENPTAGVHQAALSHAINWAADWPSTPPCESILILGPTFSGTSDSMSRVLELARARRVSRGIRIVSGSATDPQNKATLERTANVTFHATVNPDSSLLATLMGHFRSLDWTTPIAILHEANTQYGRQMQKHLVKAMPDARRGDLIETQFPMNLSRLRTTADRKAADNDSGVDLQTTMRPLAMEDKEDAKDKIPQYFPGTANAYIALGLARMLETLGQAEVKSVAIMATDPRDKLYLAQQLALHRPDVSVLTAETDSLYLHPDYSAYMRGALVASTYPLYGALQHWTYGRWTFGEGPADAQREFANDSAQGVYNATLALIDYDQDPTSHTPYAPAVPNVPSPPPLLGYGLPELDCERQCRPPVWVGVVGRKTVLPLRAFEVTDDSGTIQTGPYILEVSPQWKTRPGSAAPAAANAAPETRQTGGRAAPFPSPVLDAAFLIVSAAVLAYWAFTRQVRRRLDDSLGRHGHRRQLAGFLCTPKARGRGSFLAALAGVAMVQTYAAVLCVARLRVDHWSPWSLCATVIVVACLAALADMTLPVARRFVTDDLTRRRLLSPERFGWRRPATWAGAGIAGLIVTGIVGLLAYEWSLVAGVIDEAPVAIGLIARAADPTSGVCPTLPIVLLGGAITLWGVLELARLRSPHVALGEPGVYPLVRQMVHGHIDSLAADWRLLDRSIMTVPARLGVVVALGALATCIFSFDPWLRSLATVEGSWFGHFASATLLLVQVMVSLALLQFVCLWTSLRRLLERMAWHPMAVAFDRVPRELFPKSLLVRVPKLMELQRLVADPGASATSAAAEKLDQSFKWDMKQSPIPKWSASDTWRMLLQRATVSSLMPAASPAGAVALAGAGGAAAMPGEPATADRPGRASAEGPNELAAMAMTLIIRDALARLGYNLVFVIGAILLVFGSHIVFPYRQHQSLAALDWLFIGFAFAAIVVVLAQMKRNDIIGRLAAANPGERATWDAEFVLKLTVFGLLPLLTLFAAQFPEIGGTLLHWLEPVEKVLP